MKKHMRSHPTVATGSPVGTASPDHLPTIPARGLLRRSGKSLIVTQAEEHAPRLRVGSRRLRSISPQWWNGNCGDPAGRAGRVVIDDLRLPRGRGLQPRASNRPVDLALMPASPCPWQSEPSTIVSRRPMNRLLHLAHVVGEGAARPIRA